MVPVLAYTAVSKGKSWQVGYCGRWCVHLVGDENLRTMGFANAAAFVLLEEAFLDHALVAYKAMAATPDGNPLHVLLAHHAAIIVFAIAAGFDVHGVAGAFGDPCCSIAGGDDDNQTVHVDDDLVAAFTSSSSSSIAADHGNCSKVV